MQTRVLHFVSVMNRAGQETLIMNLYRNIDRSKVQFLFLCTNRIKGDFDEEISELGGKIFYLEELKCKGVLKYYKRTKTLYQWLKQNKDFVDVAHLHTHHASGVLVHWIACKCAGIRFIAHSHNTTGPHIYFHKFCRFILNFLEFTRFACGYEAARWMYGDRKLKKGEVCIIHNGIDTRKYKYTDGGRTSIRRELGIEGKTVIGHVGRFSEQKNHTFLISVFEEYHKLNSDSVLLLIGEGHLRTNMESLVKAKGMEKSILFLGTRSDIPELLSAMDLFLFPSLFEGLSVAAIEVQCNGLTCLTSDIPSMRESNITSLLHFRSLSDSVESWAIDIGRILMENKTNRNSYCNEVRQQGYDIYDVAKDIENKYIHLNTKSHQ